MTTEVRESQEESLRETKKMTVESQLDFYRKSASFCSNQMKEYVDDCLKIKMNVWKVLESDKIFHPLLIPIPPEEEKKLTCLQLSRYVKSGLFNQIHSMKYADKTKYLIVVNEATEMLNPCLSIKMALGVSLFSNAILNLGTERHLQFYHDVWQGRIVSCLAITELAHGSDTKRFKTTATYDHSAQQFVINSPTLDSAKCWVGNLGMQCTHALLFAQLVVDGICHGLHAFIVPVRDPTTMKPYPNIIVGDVGHKCGLHGIDNGFILFTSYRIPKENLLNRTGDINEDGEYETSFTDPQRVLGAALECLSAGRIGIMTESLNGLTKSIVIAVRYAAQRSQFTDANGNELSLLEYQSHQWRLFPYMAATYAIKIYLNKFTSQYVECVQSSQMGEIDVDKGTLTVTGVHALVSCSKSYISWLARDAIQEAREACGGHGYLRAAGLGELRNNHDPRVTFEGDNTVLLQQTSNWLVRRYLDAKKEDHSVFPLVNIAFFRQAETILKAKFSPSQARHLVSSAFITEVYQWLICWLCKSTIEKSNYLSQTYDDSFKIKSMCQVYKARELALIFAQYNILQYFWDQCCSSPPELKPVLEKLYFLFGFWSLYKHIPFLYQGGYCCSAELVGSLSENILSLCGELKQNAVALVDALAPPDFVLNSVLGASSGQVYERLLNVFQTPSNLEAPWTLQFGMQSKI